MFYFCRQKLLCFMSKPNSQKFAKNSRKFLKQKTPQAVKPVGFVFCKYFVQILELGVVCADFVGLACNVFAFGPNCVVKQEFKFEVFLNVFLFPNPFLVANALH